MSIDRPTDIGGMLPASLLEDAAAWYARRREPIGDRRQEAAQARAFEAWLRADPRHPAALREVERLWQVLDEPVARAMAKAPDATSVPAPQSWGGRRRFGRMHMLAMSASVAVVAVFGAVWYDDAATMIASDYRTAVGERAPVRLSDGSHVTLNSDSALAVDLQQHDRRARLLLGEAWFDIAPQADRSFVVDTPQGRIRVTGTRFNVRLEPGQAVVSLDHGRVELTSPAGGAAPLVLRPEQQAVLRDGGVSPPQAFDRTEVTAWLRGQIVFYDTPLRQVVDAINQHRRGRIVIVGEELERLRVSGVFGLDDPDAALTAITATLPIRLSRLTPYLVLLR